VSPRGAESPPERGRRDDEAAWSILPIAGFFTSALPTSTRLGMPFVVRPLDRAPMDTEGMTSAFGSWSRPPWRMHLTATETGITYLAAPNSGPGEVERLRDEISRRSRLTRQQIARAIGVDRRSLSAWVKGEATPGRARFERLQLLAGLVREIEAAEPGRSAEILLRRSDGYDLLDHIAAGRLQVAQNWRAFHGSQAVAVAERRPAKPPLHQKALNAYLRGELRPLGRSRTVRQESDYEQDLSMAEQLMADEPARRTRRGYR
jgi:transcriptional regulator with XRE-family HTH domain